MTEIELTQLFVDYANYIDLVEELRARIESAVLELGESRHIAGVKATYYKAGFETPDYKSAGAAAPAEVIERFSTVSTTVKWAEVCKAAGIEAPKGKEKPARVVVGQ